MSASSKKKLRKEQYEQKMTARQEKERAEAKKLKRYTFAFVTTLVVLIIAAVIIGTYRWYEHSGKREKSTIAATFGDYKMNSVEMSYYYNDAINDFYSQAYTSSYAEMYFEYLGLDLSKPLNKQINPETEDTWANYFIDSALETAQSDFALYNLAMEAGFQLTEEQQTTFDSEIKILKANAEYYGGVDSYLTQIYGYGSGIKSYTKYLERREIAEAYYNAYYEGLTYTDEEIRAYEEDKYNDYSSYTYAYAYLSYKDFLEGGTKNDEGTTVYTEEENVAAREKLKAAAESLLTATSVDNLKEMVAAVEINESSQLAVNQETNQLHSAVANQSSTLAAYLADENRKADEVGLVPIEAEITDEETGEKKTVTNGYYVVYFQSLDDNTKFMSNVRHLLVKPEGGHLDDTTGETVYTAAEQAIANTEAQKLLDSWKSGEATEESFIALVKEHTDDTASKETGGLYENIHPHSEYMEAFRAWAVDPARQVGDTGIVETPYGQHIMYYAGDAEQTYRDYLIAEDLRNEEIEEFYNNATNSVVVTKKDMSKINMSMVLAG